MNAKEIIYRDRRDSVAESKSQDHVDRFATLATRLDYLDVTTFSFERHVGHVRHTEEVGKSENYQSSQDFVENMVCFRWLTIAMEEGHLEPSQPTMGKTIGWPKKMVTMRSLWIDFYCWCRKHKISKDEMPEQWTFYEQLDRLFIRNNDKYEIPSLEHCRAIFVILRRQYERD